jgi:ectoine hydroxylase-related dioxygenase (phytanoyl-CoA dioxygenase family)
MIRIDCRGASTDDLAKSEQIRDAYDCFVKHGYAILDHVLPEATMQALRADFDNRYPQYLHDAETSDSLEVGKRRYMVPIALSGSFGDPLVFANPYVVALIREVLGRDAILEAFGAVVSLSGSQAQHIHSDGPPLFNSDISSVLPAHALTFALPLIEMNELHGTTAIWPGSHRSKTHNSDAAPEMPTIPVGSCLIWDFRLYHSGTENRSDSARPMVYATYARRWYQDPVNFRKGTRPRLVFDPAFIEGLPDDARELVSHSH